LFIVYDIINRSKEYSKKKTMILMVVACLFEVIGAGGTLHVSTILCWHILLLLIWAVYRKKEWIKAAILFGAIFLATVTNLAAPGHRVRKDDYVEVSLFQGVFYTCACVYNELKRLCTETFVPYIFLIIFVALFFVIKKSEKKLELNPIVVVFCGIACVFGSSFPVCYGYGKAEMASRGYEIMDLMIVIWSVLLLCSIVNTLKQMDFNLSSNSILVIVVMTLMLLTTVAIDTVEISDIPSFKCISGLADGSIKDYSDYWRDVLHQVENSEERNLVIKVDGDYIDRECMIDRVMIQEDETNWINTSMAVYYGHDTVKIIRE